MVFSSLIFLFIFLPATVVVYFACASVNRNVVLLIASLAFYFWGEAGFVLLMLGSAIANYGLGIAIESVIGESNKKRWLVRLAVALNLLPLVFYKYTVFLFDAARLVAPEPWISNFAPNDIHLPIGISFFTFQAISYLIDVSRGTTAAQRNPIDLALYISLFPQLIAGPIVRYNEVADQLRVRHTRLDDFNEGVRRFLVGFVKKTLIANVLGQLADDVFSLPVADLNAGLAALGVLAYALQIYFDFSGYSDMAIGLGRIFGFRFPENFNHPYIAKSVTEFWRRWHMSLSRWFRDYLYIPLGGNRHGPWRTYFNLCTVFLLCGLWHGANWTFIVWGGMHGLFLVIERMGFSKVLATLPAFLQHSYTLTVVLLAWVFFRADDLPHAFGYLSALVDFSRPFYWDIYLVANLDSEFWIVGFIAVLLCLPLADLKSRPWMSTFEGGVFRVRWVKSVIAIGREWVMSLMLLALSLYAIGTIASSGYNPFLYFRF